MTQPKIKITALDSATVADATATAAAYLFGQNTGTTAGLTFGYYGGRMVVDGVLTSIAAGTVGPLTASTTNYIEATRAGVVSFNTTGFSTGSIPLYVAVTGVSTITSVADQRAPTFAGVQGQISVSVAGGSNVTLTAAQVRNDTIILTGLLTANIDVIIPAVARTYNFVNNTTGAFTVRIKTSGGTGYYLQQGMRSTLACDGTDTVHNDTVVNSFDGQYGWQDLRGNFIGSRLGIAANSPTWTVVQGGVYGYTFGTTGTDEVWVNFHLPHDYVPGTPVYIHMHWAPTNTNTGTVRWACEYTLAKGYSQAAFPATTTVFLEQAGSGTALTHQIIETSLGDAIPAANLEPDVLILMHVYRDGSHVNDTYNAAAFGFECDLHYQSTLERTTKNKNFPFS